MIQSATLGFPRIGAKRELKKALEAYWAGDISKTELTNAGSKLRAHNWQLQKSKGIDIIPSGDFSFYDQMLDMTATLGAVPKRFNAIGDTVELDTYFAMARGTKDAPAMEMTKWFDTNYHYIVPEFHAGQQFKLSSNRLVAEFTEAKAIGIHTRPVIIGPITYLLLGKSKDAALTDTLDLLDTLLPTYISLLEDLKAVGADWVQIDEPMLPLIETEKERAAYIRAYGVLSSVNMKLLLATYFEGLQDQCDTLKALPVSGIHIDLIRRPEQLSAVAASLKPEQLLSLGIIDGRNVWRSDLENTFGLIEKAKTHFAGPIQIATSCSLLHTPVDLDSEVTLDDELKNWLAFATQKLDEIAALNLAAAYGANAAAPAFASSATAAASRATSKRIHNSLVDDRHQNVLPSHYRRKSEFAERCKTQKLEMNLPSFPTTTIGSFPQTKEVRVSRARFKRGELDADTYENFLRSEVKKSVRLQESLDIDVLVHGEFERNDMVEYFGEQLEGFAFTKFGWVQSYGSRYVKPPIIFGDVHRPNPMTVAWSAYAQSLTKKPMKGMLTGPVTILQWSFVRDDQPRSETCEQIALAIRDEVQDLEAAGIGLIQIDEPALREGLPLKKGEHRAYLKWAVDAFLLASTGVKDGTQIHTHMCYSEFNDIMPAIAALDADVISIETSRSDMELLQVFQEFTYPNEIGPGVYDIHSPRQPTTEEITRLLNKAKERIAPEQLWVNPDCGLKTRTWEEVIPALETMVIAAKAARNQ
jgi:5-methyltetrahydropteroyltriglutamate--homocysteine methyltransferase